MRKKKEHPLIQSFKKFISRGNVVDMAVGVIIGGAFQAIINALVQGVLMPVIALAVPQGGLDGIVTVLNAWPKGQGGDLYGGSWLRVFDGTYDAATEVVYWNNVYDKAIVNVINWGALINALIYFFIVAIVLFTILQTFTFVSKKRKEFEAQQLEAYYVKHPEERPIPKEVPPKKPTQEELLSDIKDQLVLLNKKQEKDK